MTSVERNTRLLWRWHTVQKSAPKVGACFPEPTFGADFWTACHRH